MQNRPLMAPFRVREQPDGNPQQKRIQCYHQRWLWAAALCCIFQKATWFVPLKWGHLKFHIMDKTATKTSPAFCILALKVLLNEAKINSAQSQRRSSWLGWGGKEKQRRYLTTPCAFWAGYCPYTVTVPPIPSPCKDLGKITPQWLQMGHKIDLTWQRSSDIGK